VVGPLVEDTVRVDVRRGYLGRPLRPGWALELTVSPAGKARARETDAGSKPDTLDTVRRLEVAFAPCRFGGERAYLRCPRCRHRRLTLFVWKTEVACRACFGLLYRTQVLMDEDRLDLQAARIERALGGAGERYDPPPKRPAGMRRTTYRRKLARAQQLRAAAEGIREAKEDARFNRQLPFILSRHLPRSA
jgi:hypothetical protein